MTGLDLSSFGSVVEVFTSNKKRHPENVALDVDGESYTYQQLGQMAESVAVILDRDEASERIGIYAHRTVAAYAGILGTLVSGRTYVPLNPKFPAERNRAIAASADLEQVICDCRFVEDKFLSELEATVIAFDGENTLVETEERNVQAQGDFVCTSNTPEQTEEDRQRLAYIMFTSGTTGVPKGVPISHDNVLNYVANVLELAELTDSDRFSQTFDLTFDLSVHDMFVCWAVGASLHVLPERAVMAPAKFIKEHELTVWFSVPSTIGFMQKLRMLQQNNFPSLRCSWFCGEALPAESARSWQAAAPNSFVENLYGPTEATIAFTAYRWQGSESDIELAGGYVPIGKAMGTLETAIIDESQSVVSVGESGELCLGGNQLSPGYWQNAEKTREVFLDKKFPKLCGDRWYRTGDLAKVNKEGNIEFIGRLDSQVKILGHRVELGEIERAIRSSAGTDLVAALAWPREGGSASGIAVFYSGGTDDVEGLINDCKKSLAPYMVPKIVRQIDNFPMNANGKIDRRALTNILENGK